MVIPSPALPSKPPIDRRQPNNPRRKFDAIDWALTAVLLAPYYLGVFFWWWLA